MEKPRGERLARNESVAREQQPGAGLPPHVGEARDRHGQTGRQPWEDGDLPAKGAGHLRPPGEAEDPLPVDKIGVAVHARTEEDDLAYHEPGKGPLDIGAGSFLRHRTAPWRRSSQGVTSARVLRPGPAARHAAGPATPRHDGGEGARSVECRRRRSARSTPHPAGAGSRPSHEAPQATVRARPERVPAERRRRWGRRQPFLPRRAGPARLDRAPGRWYDTDRPVGLFQSAAARPTLAHGRRSDEADGPADPSPPRAARAHAWWDAGWRKDL